MFYDLNQLRTLKLKRRRRKKKFAHVFSTFPSMERSFSDGFLDSPRLVRFEGEHSKSRILMLLELMNMETANLVYQNTTIKPSRMLRTNEEMQTVYQ
jgi:hypothetical protein